MRENVYDDEQRREILKTIFDMYGNDVVTIESCCNKVGISERTFNYWLNNFADFADDYKNARLKQQSIYNNRLAEKAQTALERLINPKPLKRTVTKTLSMQGVLTGDIETVETFEEVAPNATAVIFASKNLLQGFAEKSEVKLSGTGEGGAIVLFELPSNGRDADTND